MFKKRVNFFILSGVLSSIFIVGGFNYLLADSATNVKKIDKQTAKQLEQKRIKSLEKFSAVIDSVQKLYVNDIDSEEIINKALSGLMANLDAHSAFMSKKEFEDLRSMTEGNFSGIGIEVGLRDGVLTVISPIEGSPAFKAGLKSNDIILKIDDKSTLDMKLDQAVSLMKGKRGTNVRLTIVRKNEMKPLVFKITRDDVKIKSTYAKKIEGSNFAYLRVSSFDANVTDTAKSELKKLGKLDGIVLDLRNNPGGVLDQSVGLVSLFVKSGIVLSEKGRNNETKINAKGDAPFKDIPLVVLVNGGSASASEIVSGSLQDHNRAIIIGEQTFGKGSVQRLIPLSTGEALKITTDKYYLPSGRSIQAVGVTPNIVISSGKVNVNKDEGIELKEANLKMHLKNEFLKDDSDEKNTGHKDDKNIITKSSILNDIQLKTAIDVLKSWPIITRSDVKGNEIKKDKNTDKNSESKDK